MKKIHFIITIIGICLTCCHSSESKKVVSRNSPNVTINQPEDNENNTEEKDSVTGFTPTEDSLRREYLAEGIRCIVNNDAKGFASHCAYPIIRKRPLHDIEDSVSMVKYFNILFDDYAKNKLKNKSAKDWTNMGCNGYALDLAPENLDFGTFWDGNYEGAITAVNYSSKAEQALRQKMIAKDKASLHPSLRGKWKLDYCFKCPNGYTVRIDAPEGVEPALGNRYRMLIFFKGTSLKAKPNIIMYGTYETTGSAGNKLYTFKDKKNKAEFQYNYMIGGDMHFQKFTLKGHINYNSHQLKFFYWDDIVK